MNNNSYVETGYVVMKMVGGVPHFWGTLYEDGRETNEGWGNIKTAEIKRPWNGQTSKFKSTDWTWRGSHYIKELEKGEVVRIRKVISFQILKGAHAT